MLQFFVSTTRRRCSGRKLSQMWNQTAARERRYVETVRPVYQPSAVR